MGDIYCNGQNILEMFKHTPSAKRTLHLVEDIIGPRSFEIYISLETKCD